MRRPADCPRCETESPRVILTASGVLTHAVDKRKAIATNERSAHAPKTSARIQGRARPAAAGAQRKEETARLMTKTRSAPRAFRPHVHG